MDIATFDKNDWAHLHDIVYDTTDKKSTREELENIFNSLPHDLRHLAYQWGMNDIVFRDKAYDFLREKNNERISAKINEDSERSRKFSLFIINMLQEGRLWFSVRPGVYGEPEVDELDTVIEFPGGTERIGNDGSGSFSWRDIERLAEEQGLLKDL